jgi:hypothetical protein
MDYKEIQVSIRDTIKGSYVEINIYVDLHGYIVASRDKRRRWGAYLVGTEDWGLVCGGVRRALVITLPPPVADLPNERKIKNGGIY